MMNQEESIKKYQKILEDAELLYTESEINKVIDKKGNYGNPINLGNKINTNSDEITPFYNTEDNNLYFLNSA